jgi:hypothetical protein
VLGLESQTFLGFTHAIASSWNKLTAKLLEFVAQFLPFRLSLAPNEVSLIVLALAIPVPAYLFVVFRAVRILRNRTEYKKMFLVASGAVLVGASAILGLMIAMGFQYASSDGDMATPRSSLGLLIISAPLFEILWRRVPSYVKSLVVTLTFVATLELLYLVPVIATLLSGFVAWANSV